MAEAGAPADGSEPGEVPEAARVKLQRMFDANRDFR